MAAAGSVQTELLPLSPPQGALPRESEAEGRGPWSREAEVEPQRGHLLRFPRAQSLRLQALESQGSKPGVAAV